jgi:hypothetical protein
MREDMLCEIQGRIVTSDKEPLTGKDAWVEFLPVTPMFTAGGQDYCPLGFKARLDEDGSFKGLLSRTDMTGIEYVTHGAGGDWVIALNGPGPHHLKKLVHQGKKVRPLPFDH